jgi:hypothetical protein
VFMRNGKEVKTTANAPDKYNLSLASSDLWGQPATASW